MNNRVPPNKRYQPTEYEHAANCATHAVNAHMPTHTRTQVLKMSKYEFVDVHKDEPRLDKNITARLHNRQIAPTSCTRIWVRVCLYLMSHLCCEPLVMDNPQPAGQLRVALPLRRPMGATVSLGVWGRAQLALHHLHPVPHCVLEEEPPTVFACTHFNTMHGWDFNLTITLVQRVREQICLLTLLIWWCHLKHLITQIKYFYYYCAIQQNTYYMYKQCHSVVTRLFGLSSGLWSTVSTCVTGWWFISSLLPPTPRGKQTSLLRMHVCACVHVYVSGFVGLCSVEGLKLSDVSFPG